jgi:hypothetical protein
VKIYASFSIYAATHGYNSLFATTLLGKGIHIIEILGIMCFRRKGYDRYNSEQKPHGRPHDRLQEFDST